MISLENTRVAFKGKSTSELRKAEMLFVLVKKPVLVKSGSFLLNIANKIHFPLRWALKPTVFSHFCGGETLEECTATITRFSESGVKAVLDYAAEGVQKEEEFDEACDRILATIELSQTNPGIGFAVFKFTGIARFALLEKYGANEKLNEKEVQELERIKKRADEICNAAKNANISVMIDAEETWIQNAIDRIVEELMEKHNRDTHVVYHTLQMYRVDKLSYLKEIHKEAQIKGYLPAFKLVRGAYMEKERERAEEMNYASPIHPDKPSTDAAFDDAVKFCLENIGQISLCIGTHNEQSSIKAAEYMHANNMKPDHENIHFSQLMGMSDHISFNLARAGYNVSKYLPYGPIRLVMPYLIRRAEENTSVAGQTGRELFLIKKELRRRKQEKRKAS
ncbi:MAG: proline dehydrogenase family protein [Bacteroidales bacterium]